MRKIKEILRLYFEQKLGERQIARSANVSQSTVHDYLARFQAAGLHRPLDEEWDERRVEEALFPAGQTPSQPPRRTLPEFAKVRQELEQHRDAFGNCIGNDGADLDKWFLKRPSFDRSIRGERVFRSIVLFTDSSGTHLGVPLNGNASTFLPAGSDELYVSDSGGASGSLFEPRSITDSQLYLTAQFAPVPTALVCVACCPPDTETMTGETWLRMPVANNSRKTRLPAGSVGREARRICGLQQK